jgi:hypothetical protein
MHANMQTCMQVRRVGLRGRRPEYAGGDVHFTRLGGDSLAAMRACKRLSLAYTAAMRAHPGCAPVSCQQRGGADSGEEEEDAGVSGGGVGGDGGGGEFGEALCAPLAPVELLRRPRLRQYVAWLERELGGWPGWVRREAAAGGAMQRVEVEGRRDAAGRREAEGRREAASDAGALLRLCYGSVKALLRLCEGSVKALLRRC